MTHTNATMSSITTDEATVAELHRAWVFGWDRAEGSGTFSFRNTFGSYYDWSFPDVILYDDFDPHHRVARSAAAYGAIWEPGFNALRTARHYIADGPHVIMSDGVAASYLVFVARLEHSNGTVTGIRTTTSLVWHPTDDGWRIVREHNSTVVLTPEALDVAIAGAHR